MRTVNEGRSGCMRVGCDEMTMNISQFCDAHELPGDVAYAKKCKAESPKLSTYDAMRKLEFIAQGGQV